MQKCMYGKRDKRGTSFAHQLFTKVTWDKSGTSFVYVLDLQYSMVLITAHTVRVWYTYSYGTTVWKMYSVFCILYSVLLDLVHYE